MHPFMKLATLFMNVTEKKKSVEITPLFISVDPSRDTVGQMKNYSQDFHPSFVYLTGTRDQVAVASKAYRVYFSKVRHAATLVHIIIRFCITINYSYWVI